MTTTLSPDSRHYLTLSPAIARASRALYVQARCARARRWAALRVASAIALAVVSGIPATASASYPAMAGKWVVGSFDPGGQFTFTKAASLHGDGVTFELLDRPDTLYLQTDSDAYKGRLLGDLTGRTLDARVGVTVTPGTQFEYYGEPDGSGRPATVRLFFEAGASIGPISCPCIEKGVGSYWWSDPVSVDLEALKAGDGTLTVPMSAAEWVNNQGRRGGSDSIYSGYFTQAVADVAVIGLSFGGGRFFHNGLGIRNGTGSGSFRLVSYTAE